MATFQKTLGQVSANEPGAAGDQCVHMLPNLNR
jgi:hypothetical protein